MSRELKDLEHVRSHFTLHSSPAQVIVMNTGALIGPEAGAMMQALHSRSIGGFDHNFEIVAKRGAENFMKTTYVGYGHKSIGDCGSITVFIEGVSMLCAKAIQDWPLYNGQEASTRYIDFSKQPFMSPIPDSGILERLRSTYLMVRDALPTHLMRQFHQEEGESDKMYEKNINARAFDIARSLLPAGATTNLAWHSTIRQMGDHLDLLRHHPLEEVRIVAHQIENVLIEAYPSSFTRKRYDATEEYNAKIMRSYYYEAECLPKCLSMVHCGIDIDFLDEYCEVFYSRPIWAELPRSIDECGMLTYEFCLDFGSFRDIQRHRSVTQRMPLVTGRHGFEDWYLSEMPEEVLGDMESMLDDVFFYEQESGLSKFDLQYLIPMGFKLPNRLSGGLHGLTYLAERRARNDVHPTLQKVAYQLAYDLREQFGIQIHTDAEEGRFSRKRADQDITTAE